MWVWVKALGSKRGCGVRSDYFAGLFLLATQCGISYSSKVFSALVMTTIQIQANLVRQFEDLDTVTVLLTMDPM